MKKYFGTYIAVSLVYFLVIAFLRGWFDAYYASLWFGLLIGSVLPDLDSIVHFLYLKPEELTSQRIKKLLSEKNYAKAIELFYRSKSERPDLLFHSVLFQIIFIIFSYYIVTSTGNPFGRGLVVSFLIHLTIDQYRDLKRNLHINNWLNNFNFKFTQKQAQIYVYSMIFILLFLGLVV